MTLINMPKKWKKFTIRIFRKEDTRGYKKYLVKDAAKSMQAENVWNNYNAGDAEKIITLTIVLKKLSNKRKSGAKPLKTLINIHDLWWLILIHLKSLIT